MKRLVEIFWTATKATVGGSAGLAAGLVLAAIVMVLVPLMAAVAIPVGVITGARKALGLPISNGDDEQ